MEKISNIRDFDRLFSERFNHLVIYINRYVDNFDISKDIAQDSFIKLWERRNSVDLPVPFLFACARNSALQYLKTRKITIPIDEITSLVDMSGRDLEELLEYFDKLEKASELVEKLPPQCNAVVKKAYYDNMKIKDIAENMNISENTVKSHLKIAKKSFSKMLYINVMTFFK